MFSHHLVSFRISPSVLTHLNVEGKTSKSARVCRLIEIAHEEMCRAGPILPTDFNEGRQTYGAYLTKRQVELLQEMRSKHPGVGSFPEIMEQLLARAFTRRPELVREV